MQKTAPAINHRTIIFTSAPAILTEWNTVPAIAFDIGERAEFIAASIPSCA